MEDKIESAVSELSHNTDISFSIFETMTLRADVLLSGLLGISRSRIQKNIENENLTVNGKIVSKNSFKHFPSRSVVEFEIEPIEEISAEPEEIALNIIFENDNFLIIDKQPGLVVHPGIGNRSGTLINGVLHHLKKTNSETDLQNSIRPGLVHRIDKDTSGLIVVAKKTEAFEELALKFSVHDIEREYLCLVCGRLSQSSGTIETDHGRDPKNRVKFSALVNNGRKAVTHYSVISEYPQFSLVKVKLETGRTHQIRMHMSYIGHPVANDLLYGGVRKTIDPVLNKLFTNSGRQLLHARKLGFTLFKEKFSFSSEMPGDMKAIVDYLDLVSVSGRK